jgi:SAM-dependent methyltransferase
MLGHPPRSLAELGCGTGAVARLLARSGLEVFGVDRSVTAVARARWVSRGSVPPQNWLVADLRNFRLPKRVDLAIVPMDGLGYLIQTEALIDFFRSVRDALSSRGVLLIDLSLHPEGRAPMPIRSAWNVRLRPQGTLSVVWRSVGGAWGSPRRRWEEARITVKAPDGTRQVFWEAAPHAVLSARELGEFARTAGGFGEMRVYSGAAHRSRRSRIRRTAPGLLAEGARLIAWQRA